MIAELGINFKEVKCLNCGGAIEEKFSEVLTKYLSDEQMQRLEEKYHSVHLSAGEPILPGYGKTFFHGRKTLGGCVRLDLFMEALLEVL